MREWSPNLWRYPRAIVATKHGPQASGVGLGKFPISKFHTSHAGLQDTAATFEEAMPDRADPNEAVVSTRPENNEARILRHQSLGRGARRDPYKESGEAQRSRGQTSQVLRMNTSPALRESEDKRVQNEEQNQLKNLKSELKYLRDPLKLAQHIRHVLDHNNEEKAMALARLSSRTLANVVSWNHIINWQMQNGKTQSALHTYNEMKSRRIRPDSHTYILLLRGLANHAHHPNSLGRALSLYHAISAPQSGISATIMHTNAVLKVCARANDLDSVWDIVSKLPEQGPHAADKWTFTTIINAVRQNAILGSPGDESNLESAQRREESIIEGKRVWHVVVSRWRAGDLLVDEPFVCAMGRLLLIGARPRDWDDVLSLVHQTMGVPRLIPRLGTNARSNEPLPEIKAPYTPAEFKKTPVEEQDVFNPRLPEKPLLSHSTPQSRQRRAFAKPSNSALSLLMEACLKMAAEQPAIEYWSLLTDPGGPYAITPDLDNLQFHLRILRRQKNSTAALSSIRDIDFPAAKIKPNNRSFTIAMESCLREISHPEKAKPRDSSFTSTKEDTMAQPETEPQRRDRIRTTATHLLNLNLAKLHEPLPRTLLAYIDTIEPPSEYIRTHLGNPGAKRREARLLALSLRRLEPRAANLRSVLNFGDPSPTAGSTSQEEVTSRSSGEEDGREEKEMALKVLKRMQGAYDRAMWLDDSAALGKNSPDIPRRQGASRLKDTPGVAGTRESVSSVSPAAAGIGDGAIDESDADINAGGASGSAGSSQHSTAGGISSSSPSTTQDQTPSQRDTEMANTNPGPEFTQQQRNALFRHSCTLNDFINRMRRREERRRDREEARVLVVGDQNVEN
ncbi:MAG: hypothetical protein M1831_004985 [Alyxoria varia]|nr:MAG: hypothetical protein M1831_004985 [Alyxoria varia]